MLEKRIDAKNAISDFQEFIKSEQFKEGIEILDNPQNLIEFITKITNCESQKIDTTKEQQELKQNEDTMEEYSQIMESLRNIMGQIRKNIFSTITRASELNITLDCSDVELYRTKYRSERELKNAVAKYITFYNEKRPHARNHQKTPDATEQEYFNKNFKI